MWRFNVHRAQHTVMVGTESE